MIFLPLRPPMFHTMGMTTVMTMKTAMGMFIMSQNQLMIRMSRIKSLIQMTRSHSMIRVIRRQLNMSQSQFKMHQCKLRMKKT